MINTKAFRTLNYGLYIVTTLDGEKPVGCVANTFQQVTSSPARVSVALNKENYTANAAIKAGRYAVTCLAQDAPMELIGAFGFRTSADTNKFEGWNSGVDAAGIPYVTDFAAARFSAKIIEKVDVGTHYLLIGEVDEAETLSDAEPMTYAYYHQVKGGKTPPKASSFEDAVIEASVAIQPEPVASETEPAKAETGRIAWVCSICGHVEYLDELPADYACPLCGMSPEFFEQTVGE